MPLSELQTFANNVWIIEGPEVCDFGLSFTTRMIIIRLSDGLLWVDSPIQVPSDTLQAIKSLGPVKYLVAATPRHIWRLEAWKSVFPDAQLWTPRITSLTMNSGYIPQANVLENTPCQGWATDIDQVAFQGNPFIEETIFFHKESRTVILDDLLQNHPLESNKPLRNALINFGGVAAPNGGVPLDIRLSFFKRDLARQSLAKLLAWDFDKLIIGHGACIEKDAKPFVKRAFKWLSR